MKATTCVFYYFKIIDGYTRANRMCDALKLYGYDGYDVCKVVVRKRGSKRYVIRFNVVLEKGERAW